MRNQEADFIHAARRGNRNPEVPATNAYGQYLSACMALPELRGLWGFSSVNESGNVLDLSGQGRTLTNNGAAVRGITATGVPYALLNGSTQYFSRADEAGLDITAGLTVGGWFSVNTAPAAINGLIVKEGAYGLYTDATNRRLVGFVIGTAGTYLVIDNVFTTLSQLAFCVVRFDPATTELAVFANGQKAVNTSAGSYIANTGNALTLGSFNGGSLPASASVLGCVLAAGVVPDALITNLWNIGRNAFGV